jgi:hypothetical protein
MVLLGVVASTSAVDVEGGLSVLGVNCVDEAETEVSGLDELSEGGSLTA